METRPDHQPETACCANCGAVLTGPYCAACGQKDGPVNQPVLALLGDVLGGLTNWDGRFWSTVRELFQRPGASARGYLDDRRASRTGPVRAYLISALVFVLAFELTGITPLGLRTANQPVDGSLGDASVATASLGPMSVTLRLFRPPWEPEPEPISWQAVEAVLAELSQPPAHGEAASRAITEADLLDRGGVSALAVRLARAPAEAERRANLALNQAVLTLVVLFALLNFILHPRARLISHAIHSLYFHAALLPLVAAMSILAVFAGAVHLALGACVALAGLAGGLYLTWRGDRAVYASSRIGAAIRTAVLAVAYVLGFVAAAVALVLLAVG